ncbi:MAG: hypothetical protein EP338_14490 [Bacteroidetes bacterium]|nr:MAG: hypothetical protein EP338_14490 [Bacteroidota bacterium]
MKWIGERTSFVDHKNKTTIIIKPENVGWQKAMMGAWFLMWLVIGAIMFWSLSLEMTQKESIVVFVFLTFWAYYAYRVGRQFFWLLWGSENIKINETALVIKNSLGNYGKAVPYYLENIRKIRIQEPKQSSIQSVWEASPWIRGGERIEFDYMGKVIRFGRKLDPKDVKILFQLVTKRVETQLRQVKKREGNPIT